jgi:acetate---CoA ligase (ADP-forming)
MIWPEVRKTTMINRDNLAAFLEPKKIAIIGVSADLTKISGKPLKYLLNQEYKGDIFPVNPKYDRIAGMKCYQNLNDIPDQIDLVLINLPAEKVLSSIRACAKKQMRSAIVFSSGFAEMGGEGKIRQEALAEFAKCHDVLICGPNCQGMINFHDRVAASFSGVLDRGVLLPGNIGFVSQSGAYGGAIVNMAQELGIGFSYWISTGNECDLTSFDVIEYLINDKNTRVIAAYIEGLRDKDVNRIASIAEKAIGNRKPIVLLKAGISDIGRKAAASHTGLLTGSDSVFNAMCRQYGIIRTCDVEELIDTINALSVSHLPKGDRIGIVTTSGAAGVSTADKAFQLGLQVPEIGEGTRKELIKILPAFGSTLNPVDVTGQISHRVASEGQEGEMYKKCIRAVRKDSNIDVLLINVTMAGGQDRAPKMANDIVDVSKDTDKPILVSWLAGDLAKEGYTLLKENHIPTFRTPERCVSAIKKLVEYAQIVDRCKGTANSSIMIEKSRVEPLKSYLKTLKRRALSDYDSRRVLETYGIPMAKCIFSDSLDKTLIAAEEIGFPVALKIDSPDILHKTEAGGVQLGIKDKMELARSFENMLNNVRHRAPDSEIRGVLVQEMIQGETEIIIGISRDQQFGPTIMFGLGGIFVDVFQDISLRVAPISRNDAEHMVKEIKGYKILEGFRGKPKMDIEPIIDLLLKVSQLSIDFRDQISEIDLNPIILCETGKGATAVDSLIVLRNENGDKKTPE